MTDYPDAWHNEREEAKAAQWDAHWSTPRHGQSETTPDVWEVEE